MSGVLFVDSYVDKSGECRLFYKTSERFWSEHFRKGEKLPSIDYKKIVCFDSRKLYSIGLSADVIVYDLKLLFKSDGDLATIVKKTDSDFFKFHKAFTAHLNAIHESHVDVEHVPLREIIPNDLMLEYFCQRLYIISREWTALQPADVMEYETRVLPVWRDILKMESSKIKIDENALRELLKDKTVAVHERKFAEHVDGLLDNGFVKTKISPVGSKTWRLRVESGFNCMAIPHGKCRDLITSRFEGGKIGVFDFNAIDYRCLLKAVNDRGLLDFYENEKDFHAKTACLLGHPDKFKDLRNVAKKLTYVSIYGGSIQTLQKITGLDKSTVEDMLTVLNEKFKPISKFRADLAENARRAGYTITPGFHMINVEPEDHDGKIVGLYAQTYSSYIFNTALHSVLEILRAGEKKSKLLFPVHDELVFDIHPDEIGDVELFANAMQITGFTVKHKEGRTYGECTDS